MTARAGLARVIVSDEQVKEIQKYYDQCAAEGSTEEQIEASQRAMSCMAAILGHPDRIKKLRLNQRMLLQWLINIHDCQSRNIKTCNPHIHNNRYLKIGISDKKAGS